MLGSMQHYSIDLSPRWDEKPASQVSVSEAHKAHDTLQVDWKKEKYNIYQLQILIWMYYIAQNCIKYQKAEQTESDFKEFYLLLYLFHIAYLMFISMFKFCWCGAEIEMKIDAMQRCLLPGTFLWFGKSCSKLKCEESTSKMIIWSTICPYIYCHMYIYKPMNGSIHHINMPPILIPRCCYGTEIRLWLF